MKESKQAKAMQHTPGPWKETDYGVIMGEDVFVADCMNARNSNELVLANARLIAAAPEQNEALLEFVREVEAGTSINIGHLSYRLAKAAIAKAEGEY